MSKVALKDVFAAFSEAEKELVAAVVRDGVPRKEALALAKELMHSPRERRKSAEQARSLLAPLGIETVPEEFIELVSKVDLGRVNVWDLDFPIAIDADRGVDAYLKLVVDESEMLREDFGLKGVVAIGSIGEDYLSYVPDATGHVLIAVEHEQGATSIPVARSIKGLLFVCAKLQAAYATLMSQPQRDPEWREKVLAAVPALGEALVEPAWVHQCLAARSAPV